MHPAFSHGRWVYIFTQPLTHGWTPAAVGLLTIAGGALAIVGNVVAGWGSDRWGRRRVALVFILGQVGWTLAY
jgi:MFS family permease